MTRYLPDNLDLDEHLMDYPPQIERFHKDNLAYLLSLIHSVPANNKDLILYNGYVPLSGVIMQKRVHDYRDYLDYALETGIIETDNQYVVGTKCKGYRFTSTYTSTPTRYNITKKTLIKSAKKKSKFAADMTRKYSYLYKWFDEEGLQLDEAAYEYNDQLFETDRLTLGEEAATNRYFINCLNLDRINNHDYHLSVDPNVGRFHTNLTNLKKDFRNFITHKGEELVSIDITNSQPFISLVLTNPQFYQKGKHFNLHQIGFTHKSNTFQQQLINKLSPLIMLVNQLQVADFKDVVIEYKDLVIEGQLYEAIGEHIRNLFGGDFIYVTRDKNGKIKNKYDIKKDERKLAKTSMFQTMFSANQFFGSEEARPKKAFAKRFPRIYEIFKLIKQGDKTTLARLMQRTESYLMLDVICKRISKEQPKAPLFTIHDSITTTAQYAPYVEQVMTEELSRCIGYTPTLSVEHWSTGQFMEEEEELVLSDELVEVINQITV